MKTKNTKQEKVAEINGLKTKLLVIGVTTIGAFVLSGCQEQTIGLNTEHKSFNTPVFVKETTFKSVPTQLTSKVTFMKNSPREIIKTDQKSIEPLVNYTNNWSKHQDASLHKLNLNKESWKDSYDGKGLPLLRVSF